MHLLSTLSRAAAVLVIGVASLTAPASAQEHPAGDHGDDLQKHFDRFLDAYNSASPDSLRAFYDGAFDVGFVEGRFGDAAAAARERVRLHREYGPLELHSVDSAGPTTVFWARGSVTRGWLGFEYLSSDGEPGRIDRSILWRLLPGHHGIFRHLEGEALRDSLDAYLSRMEREGYFSGVVLVTEGGEELFEGAYGLADRERGIPVTTETRFNIASSAKMLTGVALLQLAEEGRVSLDDPVSEWIPEYPAGVGKKVRLEHLLTHTSGIELDEVDAYRETVGDTASLVTALAAQLRHARSLDSDSLAPGSSFDYTNEGFDLAGAVVQRASGRSWRDYLSERVLEPAGMTSTAFAAESAEGGVATGYALERPAEGASLRRVPRTFVDVRARPAGQLFSTARDLAGFLRSLLEGKLLGRRWVTRMTSPRVEVFDMPRFGARADYGYAMMIQRRGLVRWYGHPGGIPAGGAQVRHYPEVDRTVIVLSNFGVYAPYIVAGHIEELVALPDR